MATFSWVTEGFDAFRAGTFGNGGQNIYVSHKGILQRIFQHDLNHNGFFDLVFANCQKHHEAAESYVYSLTGERSILSGQGAVSGVVDDLFDSGYQDIVIAGRYDMAAPYATSDIYFGSPEAYSTKYHVRIPTPWSENVTSGRFKPGKKSLVFAMPIYKQIRIFDQTDTGFTWDGFVDWDVHAQQVLAVDLDGDNFDELIVVNNDLTFGRVYWGGVEGINENNYTDLPLPQADEIQFLQYSDNLKSQMEKDVNVFPQIRKGVCQKHNVAVLVTGKKLIMYASDMQRQIFRLDELEVPGVLAGAVSDDLITAAARPESKIYRNKKLVGKIATPQAADTAIMPDGSVLFANNGGDKTYTCNCVRCSENGEILQNFEGEDTRRIIPIVAQHQEPAVLLINRYSRSSIGFDKCYIYWGSKEGYNPENLQEVPGWCAVDSLCADFDDDGWAELLIGNNSENSMWLDRGHHLHYFGANGFIPEKTRTLPTELGWGVIAGDFNHDGYLDIISCCNKWSDLRIYHGCDNFQTWEDIKIGAEWSLRWLGAYDLNNNGYLDLVIPHKNNPLILWGSKEGYSLERSTRLNCYFGLTCAAADFTGNGYLDLVIGGHTETPSGGYLKPKQPHHSYVYIYWGGPEGFSEQRKCVLRADAANSFAIADFNNDGWLDLFVGNYHSGKDRDINSFLYWNRKGKFDELDREQLFTHSASGCIAADFNEDGYIDLAVANHKVDGDHKGWSAVWWNGPEGFNSSRCTKLPTNGPHGMTTINPGNIKNRGPEEYYVSAPFKAMQSAIPTSVQMEMELPDKCWVNIRFRSAECTDNLKDAQWSSWYKLKTDKNTLPELNTGLYWQYELALGAINALRTPRISKINISMKNK